MSRCRWSEGQLSAYVDGESGHEEATIDAHLAGCATCRSTVSDLGAIGDALRADIDERLGEVDTGPALRQIRARIEEHRTSRLRVRLGAWLEDQWWLHRRAIAGLAVAAALGALSAPAVVWWVGRQLQEQEDARVAGVVVESLEVGDRSTAVVLREGGSTTTLIWVEQQEDL